MSDGILSNLLKQQRVGVRVTLPDNSSWDDVKHNLNECRQELKQDNKRQHSWVHVKIFPQEKCDNQDIQMDQREIIVETNCKEYYRISKPGVYKIKSSRDNAKRPYAYIALKCVDGDKIRNVLLVPPRFLKTLKTNVKTMNSVFDTVFFVDTKQMEILLLYDK
jgi:hypothetical protein